MTAEHKARDFIFELNELLAEISNENASEQMRLGAFRVAGLFEHKLRSFYPDGAPFDVRLIDVERWFVEGASK